VHKGVSTVLPLDFSKLQHFAVSLSKLYTFSTKNFLIYDIRTTAGTYFRYLTVLVSISERETKCVSIAYKYTRICDGTVNYNRLIEGFDRDVDKILIYFTIRTRNAIYNRKLYDGYNTEVIEIHFTYVLIPTHTHTHTHTHSCDRKLTFSVKEIPTTARGLFVRFK